MKEHPGPPSFLASLLPLPSTDPWEPAGALGGQPVPTDGTTGKCQVIQVPTSSAMLSTAWTTRWNMSLKFVCGFFPMWGRKKPHEALALTMLKGFYMARVVFIVQTNPSMWGEHVQIRAGCVLGAWLLAWGVDKWAWITRDVLTPQIRTRN